MAEKKVVPPIQPPVNAHQIKVERTAHYYTIGQPGPDIEYLWIACHGYAQLASKMVHKFSELDNGKHLIVAPEGLSRFYWGGLTGEVASSWMTKYDRLDEIADFTQYIRTIYNYFVEQLNPNVKIILFGFSQGCATQCRWIIREFPKFDTLVLWAGVLPEDLDYNHYPEYFADKKTYWVYGTQDQFLNENRINWHLDFAKAQGLNLEVITFEDKHRINRKVLNELVEKIITDISIPKN